MVHSTLFLFGSVTSTVFDILPCHIELLKIMYRNQRPCPLLFHSCIIVSGKASLDLVAWEPLKVLPPIASQNEVGLYNALSYVHKTPGASCPWPLARLTLLSFDPALKRIFEQFRALRLGANPFCAQ
jgi:hypothetical protein